MVSGLDDQGGRSHTEQVAQAAFAVLRDAP